MKVAPSQEILTPAVGAMSSLKCSRATNCSVWGIADVDGGSNGSPIFRFSEHSILRAGAIDADLPLSNLVSSAAALKPQIARTKTRPRLRLKRRIFWFP